MRPRTEGLPRDCLVVSAYPDGLVPDFGGFEDLSVVHVCMIRLFSLSHLRLAGPKGLSPSVFVPS